MQSKPLPICRADERALSSSKRSYTANPVILPPITLMKSVRGMQPALTETLRLYQTSTERCERVAALPRPR